ncbi:MAG: exosortase-associated EpsI family protein [Pirellulales bacterium]
MTLVVAMTAAAGAVDGLLRNRWGEPPNLAAAARKLEQVPRQFGDWKMESSIELDEEIVRLLQSAGQINRVYVNQQTRDRIHVAVLVGPAGPMSVHTPEICYSSRDYELVEGPQAFQVATARGPESFWGVTFRSPGQQRNVLRVAYAWSKGDAWSAPSRPRFAYGGEPMLYKMQLAGYTPQGLLGDPCSSFLEEFLPQLLPALERPKP